jgi:hypothetical protein
VHKPDDLRLGNPNPFELRIIPDFASGVDKPPKIE